MGITWKHLDELEKKNYADYTNGQSTFEVSEVMRLLYCTRKYKETVRDIIKKDVKAHLRLSERERKDLLGFLCYASNNRLQSVDYTPEENHKFFAKLISQLERK